MLDLVHTMIHTLLVQKLSPPHVVETSPDANATAMPSSSLSSGETRQQDAVASCQTPGTQSTKVAATAAAKPKLKTVKGFFNASLSRPRHHQVEEEGEQEEAAQYRLGLRYKHHTDIQCSHTNTHTYTHIHTHTHMFTHKYTHIHTQILTHTCTHTRART